MDAFLDRQRSGHGALRPPRPDVSDPDHAGQGVRRRQLHQPPHVVGKVLHPDLGLRPHQADGADQRAAHVVGLRTEDMLDPDPDRRFGPVAGLALFAQRLAAFVLTQRNLLRLGR